MFILFYVSLLIFFRSFIFLYIRLGPRSWSIWSTTYCGFDAGVESSIHFTTLLIHVIFLCKSIGTCRCETVTFSVSFFIVQVICKIELLFFKNNWGKIGKKLLCVLIKSIYNIVMLTKQHLCRCRVALLGGHCLIFKTVRKKR